MISIRVLILVTFLLVALAIDPFPGLKDITKKFEGRPRRQLYAEHSGSHGTHQPHSGSPGPHWTGSPKPHGTGSPKAHGTWTGAPHGNGTAWESSINKIKAEGKKFHHTPTPKP